MNTKGKIAIKESKTRISRAVLMRLAGVSAMLTGLDISVKGMFHPIYYAFNIVCHQNLLETLRIEN